MPTAICDGIATRYDVIGSGPPLLMFSPGGFDATIEKWATQGIYTRIKPLDHLSKHFSCIVFDRRESGQSGGRVEAISWSQYVAQGRALLERLGIVRTRVLGACMGCSPAMELAVAHPGLVQRLVLYWPVGGARYRINSHARFAEHLQHVEQHGLEGVVVLAQTEGRRASRMRWAVREQSRHRGDHAAVRRRGGGRYRDELHLRDGAVREHLHARGATDRVQSRFDGDSARPCRRRADLPWAGATSATTFAAGDVGMARMIRIGIVATAILIVLVATIHLMMARLV